jgi:iron complex transport system ATP-binding protein
MVSVVAVGAAHEDVKSPVRARDCRAQAAVILAQKLADQTKARLQLERVLEEDPAHQLALFEHFAKLAALGRTVVVALHDLSLAARFCHRIALMDGGRVVAAGAPRDVLTVEHLAAVYRIEARYAELDGVPIVLPRRLLP